MSLEDELEKIVGNTDQTQAGFVSMALNWSSFFNTLIAHNMTREEALALTVASAAALFTGATNRPPDGAA